MKFLTDPAWNLMAVIRHYACMRLKFRSSVLGQSLSMISCNQVALQSGNRFGVFAELNTHVSGYCEYQKGYDDPAKDRV